MEAGTDVFKAKISATDDASGVIAAIKSRIRALGSEAHGAGEQVKHLHQPGVFSLLREHTEKTGESFHEMGEHVAHVGEKIADLVPAITAFGAAGSLAAMLETTEKVADAYGELNHTAQGLGVQAQQLHEWNTVARLTDTNAESMDRSMAKLNRTLADASSGKSKDAAELFQQLHLDPRQFKDSAAALPALADAFAHTADATKRAQMAQVLFGKAGTEMIPLLMRGRDGIAALQAEAKKLGFNFADSGEGLEAYNASMKRMGVATDAFKDAVGADLAPVLAPVIDQVTEWTSANRDWIAADLAGSVKDVAGWVQAVPWKEVGGELKEWAHDAEWFVEKIGGAKVLVGLLAGAMVAKGAAFLFAETVQVGKFAVEMLLGIARLGVMAAGWLGVGAAATEAAAAEELANKAAGGGVGGAAKAAAKMLGGAAVEEGGAVAAGGASVAGAATVLAGGAVAGAGALAVAVPLAVGLKTAADALDRATGMDKYEARHVNAGQRGGTGRGTDNGPRHVSGGQLVAVAPDMHGAPASVGQRAVAPAPASRTSVQATAKVDGKVAVEVKLVNAPPGTTATATGSGVAAKPSVSAGQAFHDHI